MVIFGKTCLFMYAGVFMIGDMRMNKNNTSRIKHYGMITGEAKGNMHVFVSEKVIIFTKKICICEYFFFWFFLDNKGW